MTELFKNRAEARAESRRRVEAFCKSLVALAEEHELRTMHLHPSDTWTVLKAFKTVVIDKLP